MIKGIVIAAGSLMLAACGSPSPSSNASASSSASGSASPSTPIASTASPAALGIHFVQPDPSAAKIAGSQSADFFSDFIAFHEVGLRAGETVAYQATGTGTANYACNRTDGTLDSAPGSQQVATAPVQARHAFVADAHGEISAVISVAPPAPRNSSCPNGYAIALWRSSFSNMTVTDQANNVSFSAADSGSQAQ